MEVFHILFVDFGFVQHRSSLFNSQFSYGKLELFAFIDFGILPLEHLILHQRGEGRQHMRPAAFIGVDGPIHWQQIFHGYTSLGVSVLLRLLVTQLDVSRSILSLEELSCIIIQSLLFKRGSIRHLELILRFS